MSDQEKLEIFEVSLRCNNPECNNISREVTSDVFKSIYRVVCAKCGCGGFTLIGMKNLFGDAGPTKFSFE
jgi:hypothetical protein